MKTGLAAGDAAGRLGALARLRPVARLHPLALALVGVAALATLGAGCGEEEVKPPPALPGVANDDPGAPEFGENVIRVPGLAPEDVAAAAMIAIYPPDEDTSPSGWVLFPKAQWPLAVTAAQFAGDPVNGGVLPTERRYLPTPIADVMDRSSPEGFPNGQGLQAILLGDPSNELVVDAEDLGLQISQVDAPSPADLAAELVPFRGGYAGSYSDTVLVVSSAEEARDYALIASAWSAFSGDTIAFVEADGVPEATAELLAQREKLRTRQPTIYAFGPEALIPEAVLSELGAYGEVRRIAGETPAEAAVEFARYQDTDTGLGFGITEGPASFTLVNLDHDWQDAYAAITLAGVGPRAPILPLEDANRLPGPVRDYLASLKAEEPNQVFALGDRNGIASPLIARLDRLLAARPKEEKEEEGRDEAGEAAEQEPDGGEAGGPTTGQGERGEQEQDREAGGGRADGQPDEGTPAGDAQTGGTPGEG